MAVCTFFARRLPDRCAFVLTKWSENRGAVPAGRSAVYISMINIKIIYVARDLQSGERAPPAGCVQEAAQRVKPSYHCKEVTYENWCLCSDWQ